MTNMLIADSGSTKTKWSLIKSQKESISLTTTGINPYYMGKEDILGIIKTVAESIQGDYPNSIYYYGAGCNTTFEKKLLIDAIGQVFNTADIFAESDMLGAARALCQHSTGIACVLGTGSNSCYYDGRKITSNVSPLGFILGDEGSGAAIGKKLISDILKKQLPTKIITSFLDTYKITNNQQIISKVYKEPFPNRYLAQFTRFIHTNIHIPELENLVIKSFDEFISRNLLQYPVVKISKIHFTGSIAYTFDQQLIKVMHNYKLQLGRITKDPMQDLVSFHTKV